MKKNKYVAVLQLTMEQLLEVEASDREDAIKEVEKKIDQTNYQVLTGPYMRFLEVACVEKWNLPSLFP